MGAEEPPLGAGPARQTMEVGSGSLGQVATKPSGYCYLHERLSEGRGLGGEKKGSAEEVFQLYYAFF